MLAPAAADPVLELNGLFKVFAFPLLERFLVFVFHAASGCRLACSAFTPIAQIKPSSSRPTAAMIFL